MTKGPEPFSDFEIGKGYHSHREIWEAAPGFGSFLARINHKGRFPNTEGIIILSHLDHGLHADVFEEVIFMIRGEDDRTP